MDAQKDYIRQRVQRMAATKKSPTYQAIVVPKSKAKTKAGSNDWLSGFLLLCIFVVSVVVLITLFLMSDKGKELWGKLSVRSTPVAASPLPEPKANIKPETRPEFMPKDETHQFISATNKRLDTLERDVKVWAHRTWVLGVASNENAVLSDKMDIDHHNVGNRGFVRIGENWTLAPLPQNMPNLSEEDKKQLQEGFKPQL